MDEAFAHAAEGKSSKKGYEPPDGGWGYMVCIGVGLTFMLGFGSSSAFGILFNDFFKERGGASGLTLVIGVYNGALSISGFLSGIALNKYSYRQVGLVGAGLFVLGDLITIFVQQTYHLVISFGLIRGTGFGIMIPVSYTAFTNYFTKKRTAMMSANQTMSSLASITFPLLTTFLLNEYGFRWTLALIFAIDLHVIFAMMVMHPVEWHLVAVNRDIRKVYGHGDVVVVGSVKRDDCDVITHMIVDHDAEMAECEKGKDSVKQEKNKHNSFKNSFIKPICESVDWVLLKDPRFLCTLLGLGFAFVSDVTYLALEPMLLFSYNFSKIQVATCIMVGAIADLAARFLLAVITYFHDVDSRQLFFWGTCVTMLLRIALVSYSDMTYVYIVTGISGLVRCTVQVLFPLVLSTAAPDRFPAALSLHIILSGLLMLIADPLIGVIFDLTGSYVFCFMAMSVCCGVCVVLWTIDYFVYKNKEP